MSWIKAWILGKPRALVPGPWWIAELARSPATASTAMRDGLADSYPARKLFSMPSQAQASPNVIASLNNLKQHLGWSILEPDAPVNSLLTRSPQYSRVPGSCPDGFRNEPAAAIQLQYILTQGSGGSSLRRSHRHAVGCLCFCCHAVTGAPTRQCGHISSAVRFASTSPTERLPTSPHPGFRPHPSCQLCCWATPEYAT